MNKIKFSHIYDKMKGFDFALGTQLLQVFITHKEDLSEQFIEYDTKYSEGNYELPEGKLIVLVLITGNTIWTTIRRWTLEKEAYYKLNIGCQFEIQVKQ